MMVKKIKKKIENEEGYEMRSEVRKHFEKTMKERHKLLKSLAEK
jgi:hypothetical protein